MRIETAEPRVWDLRWSLLFVAAGVLLVPWIVVLAVVQPRVAPVGDLALAAGGATAAIAVGLLASAVLVLTGSRFLVLTTSATATVALCTGFFHVVTGTASNPRAAAFATLLVVAPVALLCVLAARRGPGGSATVDRLLAVLFVLGAVAAALAWARAAAAGFDAQYAHHLKLAWVVLDVAEAAVLLTTAAALRWHPARVPAAAAASGALLCCDVWFNVVGAVGEARTAAIQMAFVSLPLAVVAFLLGVRAVGRAR
ncbi:MAG TPA: hypothetical protein VGH76_07930 [Actinomycetospora sp.]|uniref:hypothetical protein n=1 Tax=Actinomycetospora sp. TaxID=1872135 RepID=UPI002F40A793